MPLQVISEALNLPEAVVRINEPAWAFACTLNLGTSTGLLVFRSLALRDTDPMYAPVADLINRSRPQELIRVEAEDPAIMFGRVEGFVLLLHPCGTHLVPSPEQQIFSDIFRSWGEPVPIPQIHEKLKDMCARVMH